MVACYFELNFFILLINRCLFVLFKQGYNSKTIVAFRKNVKCTLNFILFFSNPYIFAM